MDFAKMMEMANQMREQMSSAQARAGDLKEVGEAGGGMVQVEMSGLHEVSRVTIDPALCKGDDVGFLEDLVRAAINQASGKIADRLKQDAGQMASNMGIDLSELGFPTKE